MVQTSFTVVVSDYPRCNPLSVSEEYFSIYPINLLSAILFSALAAPRSEILIDLACAVHRPEYHYTTASSHATLKSVHSADRRCGSDPLVLAEVAKLVTSMSTLLFLFGILPSENILCSASSNCRDFDVFDGRLVGPGQH